MKKRSILAIFMAMLLSLGLFAGCAKPFKVTFDGNGGEYVSGREVQTVKSASEIVPPVYSKVGYELASWDKIIADISADTTVKAIWRAKQYTLTLDPGDGNTCALESVSVTYDQIVGNVLPKPVYADNTHTFESWRISAEGEDYHGRVVNKDTLWQIDSDVTLVASWTQDLWAITYNGVAGAVFEADNPARYGSNSTDIVLNNPTKEGYKFLGWATSGITEPTLNMTIPQGSTGNKVFTANWEAYDYKLEFSVGTVVRANKVYVSVDGKRVDFNRYIDAGESFGAKLPVATLNEGDKQAYRIVGWYYYDSSDNKTYLTADTVIDQSVVGIDGVLEVFIELRALYTNNY